MNAHVAVIGRHTSETVPASGGAPLDLADTAVPSSSDGPAATRLFRAIRETLREMRVRQRQVPGDATSPLRLGLIVTRQNGTGMDIQTGSVNLRDLDLASSGDRAILLDELRNLEQKFLTGN